MFTVGADFQRLRDGVEDNLASSQRALNEYDEEHRKVYNVGTPRVTAETAGSLRSQSPEAARRDKKRSRSAHSETQ